MSLEMAEKKSGEGPNGTSAGGRRIEPLDARITSIQPGGGVCMKLELAWGHIRRWLLKTLRPRYVAQMQATRRGLRNVCPHEVLDPRDIKFFRNLGGYYWLPDDDPFAWRDRLPVVRVGLAELLLIDGLLLMLAAISVWVAWPLAVVFAVPALAVAWFFRNPRRSVPTEPGCLVSPADGKVVAVEEVDEEFVGSAAVRLVIFLSVFNVHINRSPAHAVVIALKYRRGKFLNALRAAASRENEQLEIRLEESAPPYRPLIVRQIAGTIARRIVCWTAPGQRLARGEALGMIKLGSRTEILFAREPGLEICVHVGQTVHAGVTVLGKYPTGYAVPAPAGWQESSHGAIAGS